MIPLIVLEELNESLSERSGHGQVLQIQICQIKTKCPVLGPCLDDKAKE